MKPNRQSDWNCSQCGKTKTDFFSTDGLYLPPLCDCGMPMICTGVKTLGVVFVTGEEVFSESVESHAMNGHRRYEYEV